MVSDAGARQAKSLPLAIITSAQGGQKLLAEASVHLGAGAFTLWRPISIRLPE